MKIRVLKQGVPLLDSEGIVVAQGECKLYARYDKGRDGIIITILTPQGELTGIISNSELLVVNS